MTMEAYDGSRHREVSVRLNDGSQWVDGPLYLHDGSYWIRQKTRPQVGVSRWTFDTADTDSGTAVDTWGTNDGTINGATTGQSGANVTYNTAEAYDFDGTDDNITFTSSPANGLSALTVSAWVKIDDNSTYNTVISGRDGSNSGFELNQRGDLNGNLKFVLYNSGNTGAVTTGFTPNNGQWYHLIGTADSNGAELYVDGSSIGTAAVGLVTNDILEIARSTSFADGFFDGQIDDVRIYDKALTDTEARRLYHLGNINYPPDSAISRWPFDDSATDSGTAVDVWDTNDATIYNGGSWTTDSVTSGYAYSFDGTDSYAKASNPGPTSDAARSVTVSFKTTDSGYLVGYGDTGVGTSLRVGVSTYGDQEGITIDIGSGAVNYVANVQDGNWHTVTAVVPAVSNPELRDVKVYLDGNELTNRGTYTNLDRGISTSSANGLTFGGLPWLTSSKYLNGKLDEARVHSTELTETEADRLYNVGAI